MERIEHTQSIRSNDRYATKHYSSLASAVCLAFLITGCSTTPRHDGTVSGSTIAATVISDPEVLAASERLAQADAELVRARAEFLPSLTANASLVSEEDATGSLQEVTESVGFRASLPLFQGFSGINGLRQADAERLVAGSGYDRAYDTAIARLVIAVAQVERDSSTVAARQRELSSLRGFYQDSRQRRSTGIISGADLDQIRAQVAETEAQLTRSQGSLSASQANLTSLLGDIGVENLEIQDISSLLPHTEAEAIQVAVAESPILREAHWAVEASRRSVEVAMGTFAPTADFSIIGEHTNDPTATNNGELDLEFRVDVQVPLFDGGRRIADVQASQSSHRERTHRYQAARRDLVASVQAAWARFHASRSVTRVTQEQSAAARRALTAIQEARRIGARSINDELSARRDALNADVAVSNARFEQVEAGHDLILQMGRINLAYNVSN